VLLRRRRARRGCPAAAGSARTGAPRSADLHGPAGSRCSRITAALLAFAATLSSQGQGGSYSAANATRAGDHPPQPGTRPTGVRQEPAASTLLRVNVGWGTAPRTVAVECSTDWHAVSSINYTESPCAAGGCSCSERQAAVAASGQLPAACWRRRGRRRHTDGKSGEGDGAGAHSSSRRGGGGGGWCQD